MRLVQFPFVGSPIVYPEEGIGAFGITEVGGGFVFGEYNGAQTHPTLADYVGVWPVPPDPVTSAIIDTPRLFDPLVGFTGAEQDAIRTSADLDVQAALHSIEMRPQVDTDDEEVQALFQLFVDDGDITSNRRDALVAGV